MEKFNFTPVLKKRNKIIKIKKILIILSIFTLGFFLISCGPVMEKSGNLHEKAIIVNMIYTPSRHDIYLGKTIMKDYNNPLGGIDINGNKGIIIGEDMQISTSTIPEKYGVVFQCQHGTFTIQGDNKEGEISKYKILYDKLWGHVGDTVNVIYQEIYHVYYKKNKETGKKEETKRVLVDLDFIDAQLIK
jgi:hypothetical protein